jgi:hypothetical protein
MLVDSGNILIIGSVTSLVIGLTWGGVRYPWSSVHVLLPLSFGLVGLSLFVIYEFYFCKPPVVSSFQHFKSLFTNKTVFKVPILLRLDWTGTSGYLQIFMMATVTACMTRT